MAMFPGYGPDDLPDSKLRQLNVESWCLTLEHLKKLGYVLG